MPWHITCFGKDEISEGSPMSKKVENEKTSPIDLVRFENEFFDIIYGDPAGYAAKVKVYSDRDTPSKTLKETAGSDEFLSFEEAKGKIFSVPMAFCNSPGRTLFFVNTADDFRHLYYRLATPYRVYRAMGCERGDPSPAPPSIPTPPPTSPVAGPTQNVLHALVYEDLTDQIANEVFESIGPEASMAEAAVHTLGLSAMALAGGFANRALSGQLGVGLGTALGDTGNAVAQTCDWDLFDYDDEIPDHCE